MAPEEIRALRDTLGLSQEEMARRIGTTALTISRWERDKAKPRGLYARALEELARKGK